MNLKLMRHSESPGNDARVVRGWSPFGLGAEGMKLARTSAQWIEDNIPVGCVFASHIERAMDTASQVAQLKGLKVFPVTALATWRMGVAEGLPESVAEPMVDYYLEHPLESIPGGEAHAEFSGRLLAALGALEEYAAIVPTLAVTHAKCLAVIDNFISGRPTTTRIKGRWPVASVLAIDRGGLKTIFAPPQGEPTYSIPVSQGQTLNSIPQGGA